MSDLQPYILSLRGPILVTGAGGFVGANLFKTISSIRSDVYAVVRSGKSWRLSDVRNEHVISLDLNNHIALKKVINSILPGMF